MSPKEKAKELYDTFYANSYVPWMGGEMEATQEMCAKESAEFCVYQILLSNPHEEKEGFLYLGEWEQKDRAKRYWNIVLNEIKNIK